MVLRLAVRGRGYPVKGQPPHPSSTPFFDVFRPFHFPMASCFFAKKREPTNAECCAFRPSNIKLLILYHSSILLSRTFVRNIFSVFSERSESFFRAENAMQLRFYRSDRLGLYLQKHVCLSSFLRGSLSVLFGADALLCSSCQQRGSSFYMILADAQAVSC